jgi:RHS repeat-associated protein
MPLLVALPKHPSFPFWRHILLRMSLLSSQWQQKIKPPDRHKQLETVASDFQYAGYEHHASSNLNITVNRFYSASFGRWISCDIEPDGQSTKEQNLYCYVLNDRAPRTQEVILVS